MATTSRSTRLFGAYGFALEGLNEANRLLVRAPSTWPVLRLLRRHGRDPLETETVSDDRAELMLEPGGSIRVDRARREAVFTSPNEIADETIVHPFFSPVASVAARWLGRESFHAGAFLADGGAWVVSGERESGKSSLLAFLALAGHPVLADDIVVVDGETAFAGPRSIDLRETAARELEAGEALGRVGTRKRWRLHLDDVSPEVPLRGWMTLSWADELRSIPTLPADRLLSLTGARAMRIPPTRPEALVALASLPAWSVSRPRDWSSLESAARRMLDIASGRA